MSNVKKQYLSEVKRLLPYDSAQKKHCLSELDHSITQFLTDTPEASLKTMYQKFGHPEDIAASYLDRVDPAELSKATAAKRRIICCVACACALIVIIISVFAVSYMNELEDYHDGYYVDTVEEVPSNVETIPSPLTVN